MGAVQWPLPPACAVVVFTTPHGARHGRWDDPGCVILFVHAVQEGCFCIVWEPNASSMKEGRCVHTGHPAAQFTPREPVVGSVPQHPAGVKAAEM
jgi:hypothetical protein